MTRKGLVLALCAAMTVAAAPSPQAGASVEGRVTSTVNGEAVRKAIVIVRSLAEGGAAAAETYVCETDSSGRFAISGVAPGRYEVRPSRQGFESRPADRFAVKGEFPELTIASGQRVTGVELHLIPEGIFAGKVLNAEGDPMRRVNVQAMQYRYISGKRQLRTVQTGFTDDRGEFRIFNLPPGRYYLRAIPNSRGGFTMGFADGFRGQQRPENYAPAFYPNAPTPAESLPLKLAPGGELDGVDFRLSPTSTYSIRGKFSVGKPDRGMNVTARRRSNDEMLPVNPQTGFTNNGDGFSYVISNLTPGSYVVTGQIFEQGNPGGVGMYARQVVDIVNGDVDGIDLTFAPSVQLTGVVKVDGSAPVNLSSVHLSLASDDPYNNGGMQIPVSGDGAFTIKGVTPDIYHLRVLPADAYVKSIKNGDHELAERKIDTERISGGLTVTISADTGSVTGAVMDEDGKPASRAHVTLIPDQRLPDWEQSFKSSTSDDQGAFSFRGVIPGDYKVYAWYGVEPGAPQSAEFRKPYEDRGVAVKVAPNAHATAQLKVIQTATQNEN
jgi:hypothetical protein